jgi:hypothetical protein
MEHDEEVKYENDLINQRLTWLGTFEGLLFVADHYAAHPYLLPIVGLAIAGSVGIGIRAANKRLTALNAQGSPEYLMPGTVIPIIIAVAWAIILCENIRPLICR